MGRNLFFVHKECYYRTFAKDTARVSLLWAPLSLDHPRFEGIFRPGEREGTF